MTSVRIIVEDREAEVDVYVTADDIVRMGQWPLPAVLDDAVARVRRAYDIGPEEVTRG